MLSQAKKETKMKYNLNLTRDYCAHWELKDAIRELIANTIDEGGTITVDAVEPSKANDYQELVDLYLYTTSRIQLDAFMMGYSAKFGDNPIGQYGEGLKLAILILSRQEHPFVIQTDDTKFEFSFQTPKGFYLETLHLTTKAYTSKVGVEPNTTIIVKSIPKSILSKVYTTEPIGLLSYPIVGLYSQGLLVMPNVKFKANGVTYGLNIDQAIKTNRDRNYLVQQELLAPFIEKHLEPDWLANYFTSLSESMLFPKFSKEYKQALLQNYAKDVHPALYDENKIVLVGDRDEHYVPSKTFTVVPDFYFARLLNNPEYTEALRALEVDIKDDIDAEEDTKIKLSARRLSAIQRELTTKPTLQQQIEVLVGYIALTPDDRDSLVEHLVDHYLPEED